MNASDAAERGRQLEQQIAAFFLGHGYDVTSNAVLEGRSGGSHEIDVLAVTSDPLMTFRVGVECKAWSAPVTKDVVAKHDMVVRDLGLDKGIVVAPGGAAAGAMTTATELGIEIWDGDDLRDRLGDGPATELGMAPAPARAAVGWERRIDASRADALIVREARGLLGVVGREAVTESSLLWVPWHALRIAVTRSEGRLRRRTRTRRIWNLYDAMSGRLVVSDATEEVPALGEVDIAAGHLPIVVKARAIQAEIRQAFERWSEVVTEAAQERHEERLAALGIPLPAADVAIEDSSIVYQPVHLAVLRRRGGERVVAIDAHLGTRAKDLEEVLTGQVGAVRRALGAG